MGSYLFAGKTETGRKTHMHLLIEASWVSGRAPETWYGCGLWVAVEMG